MRLVGEDGDRGYRPSDINLGVMRVHASASYDFIVSLRALYNPGTYERARAWALSARKAMGPSLFDMGRPFFAGGETALGLGLLRLIPELDASNSGPADFIGHLRATSSEECAMLMLDTGETSQETLGFYRSVLQGLDGFQGRLENKASEFGDAWGERSVEVLQDPDRWKACIVEFLEGYLESVFAAIEAPIGEAVEQARSSATDLLRMQPTVSSIEALTGGYTLSAAQEMNKITLAPSVFIYPFMASRVDELGGQALIVFGVRNDAVIGYRESVPEDVLDGAKALASSHRLQILTMLRNEKLLGTEVVKRLELSQPTVHHHLAQLRSSGLIRQERTSEGMLYSFRRDTAASVVARLAQFLGVN